MANDPIRKLMGVKAIRDGVVDDTLKGTNVNTDVFKKVYDAEYGGQNQTNLKNGIDQMVKESKDSQPKNNSQPKFEAGKFGKDGQIDENMAKFFDTEDEATNFARSNGYNYVTGYTYKEGKEEPHSSFEVWNSDWDHDDDGEDLEQQESALERK